MHLIGNVKSDLLHHTAKCQLRRQKIRHQWILPESFVFSGKLIQLIKVGVLAGLQFKISGPEFIDLSLKFRLLLHAGQLLLIFQISVGITNRLYHLLYSLIYIFVRCNLHLLTTFPAIAAITLP